MRHTILALALALVAMPEQSPAQGLGSLLKKAGSAVKSSASSASSSSTSQSVQGMRSALHSGKGARANHGTVYYVDCVNGSGRAAGTQDAPMKDIQKAIDKADNGDIIRIAEGNYLGSLDQGYVTVNKYLTLQGGWSTGFTEWNPIEHKTYIQPGPECAGTNGNYGHMALEVTGNPGGVLIIDGIGFDKGEENIYCAYNPSDPVTSSPEGCLTGRMVKAGESPNCPKVGGGDINNPLIGGKVEGTFIVRNCTFTNGNSYAIKVGCVEGYFDIYNNVFCANVMSACEVWGMKADQTQCTLNFHHNTVMFTWARTKVLEDMGQGFRFMTGFGRATVSNNVFGCNILGAIERTRFDSDKNRENARHTVVTNNSFFMNNADLILPSGGGKWLFVKAKNFEDVDEKYLTEVSGNRELEQSERFEQSVDEAYLKGFAGLSVISSQSYDANSSANRFNRAFGFNQQGTEIVRPSMFANKYPFFSAYNFFGAVDDRGAQVPKQE